MAAVEEVGVLGNSLSCAYVMPSIVGRGPQSLRDQSSRKKNTWPRLWPGNYYSAEALTEPRGGSDFFGATTTAVKDGDSFILNGEKRFVVGAQDSDWFLVYAKSDPKAQPHESISCFIVERAMGVQVQNIYQFIRHQGRGNRPVGVQGCARAQGKCRR